MSWQHPPSVLERRFGLLAVALLALGIALILGALICAGPEPKRDGDLFPIYQRREGP